MDKLLLNVLLLVIYAASVSGKCKTYHTYDVTEWPVYADSHDDLDRFSRYQPNEQRCMLVYTNNSHQVIALQEVFFDLSPMSGQCTWDFLTIYDSAGFTNPIGRYCEGNGPGVINSTGPSIFLYFETDNIYEFFGFRLDASSLEVNPEGSQLTGGAIAGIVLSVILVTIAMSVGVTIFIINRTKYGKSKAGSSEGHDNEPLEHIYEVPGRCNSIATIDVRDGTINHPETPTRYVEDPISRNYGSSDTREDVSGSSDEGSIQDYKGYDLPSYIATISNNNGPSTVSGKGRNKVNLDPGMQRMVAPPPQDPPFYLTMDDNGIVEADGCISSTDEYQVPNSKSIELPDMRNENHGIAV